MVFKRLKNFYKRLNEAIKYIQSAKKRSFQTLAEKDVENAQIKLRQALEEWE